VLSSRCRKSGISPSCVVAGASIYGVRSSRWSREEPDVIAHTAGCASASVSAPSTAPADSCMRSDAPLTENEV
jgi:hypothetical protein